MKIGVFPGECLDGKGARSALASLQGASRVSETGESLTVDDVLLPGSNGIRCPVFSLGDA